MKPGIATTEFTAVAGFISALFGGVISGEHQQVIAGVVVAVYAAARTILKAISSWKQPPA